MIGGRLKLKNNVYFQYTNQHVNQGQIVVNANDKLSYHLCDDITHTNTPKGMDNIGYKHTHCDFQPIQFYLIFNFNLLID